MIEAIARRRLVVLGAAALLLLGVAIAAVVIRGGQPARADLAADLAPLAIDGEISDADLAHDSRSDLYRVPLGAVPAGTEVTLRLRAAAGDLSAAEVVVYDQLADSRLPIPMEVAARDATGGEHGYDFWHATLHTIATPTVLHYRFVAHDGTAARYVEDDDVLDGGPGRALVNSPDTPWQVTTYDPAFATPEWAEGATIYQIFPDRFANGDPSNDPSPDAVAASEGAERYRYGDVYGNRILVKAWDELPEGHCRAYANAQGCGEQPLGRDFYGGDLAGITEHLDDLADLGITILYLNPIFAAPSNHRYDTSDYFEVDPDLGTEDDLRALVDGAHGRGMRVVLDGVFNHTSSDSPFFDRAARYPEVGACEAAESPYAEWYTLTPGPPAKCFDGQSYVDWFGFDTLPALAETAGVLELVNGPDGVVRHWLTEAGIDGWRLDVMNEISHRFLHALRTAAKEANPDALILGEEWHDTSAWLLGSEADSVMNYRFRRAVIGLVNGETADPDGAIAGLSPSEFASVMEAVREDYPPQAFAVLHNLVDSHDTTRILWTLAPGADDPAEKEDPAALDEAKRLLRQLATLQLTWPGMAGIYYGDEVGLTGHDDPDDRRPYPWGGEDVVLREHYRTLATLRRDNEALRNGDLRFLLTDDEAGTLAFGRRTDGAAAITILNLSEEERAVEVDVEGWLPSGSGLTDALSGATALVGPDSFVATLPPRGSAVFFTADGADLTAPAAPLGLDAAADGTTVSLAWEATDDAAGYLVWRSIVSGGGYQLAGSAAEPSFTDDRARPGTRYHYVVTAHDAAGNLSARSAEATALPQVTVAAAELETDGVVTQELSAVDPGGPIRGTVRVDGRSDRPSATVGVKVELGFGPPETDPATDAAWRWTPMAYEDEAGGADRFTGTVRPEEEGRYAVAMRVSTSGGEDWSYAGPSGAYAADDALMLEAVASSDRTPPAAPDGLVASAVSESSVTLEWQPGTDADLYRYEVWRADDAGPELIGVSTAPTFTDTSVRAGASYRYVVTTQDTGFNRSEESAEIVAAAASREVAVTFTVTVPGHTPPGDTVYIAGDFQGWSPGGTPMERVDATTWTITLPFTEGQQPPQYKYTRGSWEAVEKDVGCGEIPNRTVTVEFGTDGTLVVADEVGKWRDVDNCG